ncbi:L-type lectin-domain containing receptor kinase SIT2-like [Hordeum vulgare subsp. vulgare]|uniref:non-specific serine/threonine protein kinase n=1 Tax=Hordeum vulgare subsp. vulgare TaxID=112509 RepID=A0A8I6YH24_HORVV|nr:L-type lectin-domain containing receptor kinase SIT2-like [Hordeum vulgare subsp. vulgare]
MDMGNHLLLLLIVVVNLHAFMHTANCDELIFNGFSEANLKLSGQASMVGRAIRLTGGITLTEGDAFYSRPLDFSSNSSGGGTSFSTTFVFAINSDTIENPSGAPGMAFVLSSTMELQHLHNNSVVQGQLGFSDVGGNSSNSGDQFSFTIELTYINDHLVEIDVKSLVSVNHTTSSNRASRASNMFESTKLSSAKPMQVWIHYNGTEQMLNVTLEEFDDHVERSKPLSLPQLSSTVNFPPLLSNSEHVYAGFSAANGKTYCSRYVIGWSFMKNGQAPPLNPLNLPQVLPNPQHQKKHILLIVSLVTLVPIVFVLVLIFSYDIRSWLKTNLAHEKWEIDCGMLQSFTYKDLFIATSGFNKKAFLGKGGFGKVYKGVLAVPEQTIAIKRVSPESKQGMKEFMAEIAILGHLRHRNLVQLIGYCRHRQELLLVYDYMPNGSLDMYLHKKDKPTLDWAQRLHIIKGVAAGLVYLHDDWEQVVIHRDIKVSNVLLDDGMNGRLGDFGLARLHGHEADAHTTRVAGTWGYIAPELARLGKATKATDVYAFGIFLMEVACGRGPLEANAHGEPLVLADWVFNRWQTGSLIDAMDTRLEQGHVTEEVELVLKLGLLCSHSLPKERPCMRLVMQYLESDATLPDFPPCFFTANSNKDEGSEDQVVAPPSAATSITGLSGGR